MKAPIAKRIRQLRALCEAGRAGGGDQCGTILAHFLGMDPGLTPLQADSLTEVAVEHFTAPGGCSECPAQVGRLPAHARARVEAAGARRGASPVASLARLKEAIGDGRTPAPPPECAECRAQVERRIGRPDPLILENGSVKCEQCLNGPAESRRSGNE
jgi:hypothetical protein